MFFLPVPVKMLFYDFPTEVSVYTISDSYTCKGFYEKDERYIIFPIKDCPEIAKGTKIQSPDGSIFIAKGTEPGGSGPTADALIVHV